MFGGTSRTAPILLLYVYIFLAACEPKQPVKHVITRNQVVMLVPESTEPVALPVSADTSYLEHVFEQYDLVDVRSLDTTIRVKLQYADTANLLHGDFYDGLRKAYTTCELAIRLCNAQYFLKQADPSLSLVVLDAARPLHIQQLMWDSLKMPPEKKRKYLTPPELTSLHNYGCAVDVTIAGADSLPLDMGTDFDQFDSLSQPRLEPFFSANGRLSEQVLYNRRLLRYAMKAAGLRAITTEWWHFSLCTKPEAVERFTLIR